LPFTHVKTRSLFIALSLLLTTWAHAAKPNVLFIAVDDLRNWQGCYGDTQAKTPNIDRLAARGLRFDRAYCGAPLCNPTRASLITGIRPHESGIYENDVKWSAVLKDEVTIPQLFKQQGYYVSGAGKIVHATAIRTEDWNDFGPINDHIETLDLNIKSRRKNDQRFGKFAWHMVPNADEAALIDYRSTSYVIERIQKQPQDKPFFLALGIHRPHVPWNVPQKYFDLYPLEKIQQPKILANDLSDVGPVAKEMAPAEVDAEMRAIPQGPEQVIRAYLAATSFCDAQIGRALDALDQSPHKDNTIIVLWGDHGWNHGEKQHWTKHVLWEESTRAPLLCVAPGVTRPGSVCARTVDFLSLFPTLCDLAGFPIPAQCKSPSLKPLLADPKAPWDRPALTTMGFNNHALRDERWRYIRYHTGEEELYDHNTDPNEWKNVAALPENAAVKARLAKWLPTVNVPSKGRGGNDEDTTPTKGKRKGKKK
jgi:arylsulfatase A-like enzyme